MNVRPSIFCLCALLFSVSARADAEDLTLSITGPCTNDLRKEVMASLGRPLTDADTLSADVAIQHTRTGLRVMVGLERSGARSRRVLDAADCDAAVHAAGLVIAIAIDPEAALREETPPDVEPATPPPPPPEEQTSAPSEEQPAPEPPPESPPSSSPRFFLAGDALLDTGTLPGWNGGGDLAFGMNFDLLRVEVTASLLASAQAKPNAPGARVDMWFATGAVSAGAFWTFEKILRLSATAGFEAGAMIGTGSGTRVLNGTTSSAPWLAVEAALGAEVHVFGPLFIRARASLGAPLLGPAFQITGLGTVYTPSDLFVRGALGVGLDLP